MLFKKDRAITAVELLITISVMGIMFTMIAAIGLLLKQSYLSQSSLSNMQQDASVALAKLSRELMETSCKTASIYNPADITQPTGIIFASARDFNQNNEFQIDPNTAKCIWYKYVCYYIDIDEKLGERALYRREFLQDPAGGTTGTTTPLPCTLSVSSFITGGSITYGWLPKMIVAHRVRDLNFPDLGVSSTGIPPSVIGTKLPLRVDITICEKPDTNFDPNNTNSSYNSLTVSFTMNMSN
ncbi:MAG: hypothetical protein ABRQ37_16680 [Candidatus Eremiobacterota bacterium]